MRIGGLQQPGAAARSGLAGFGIAAFVVVCCGALPLVAGVLGGLVLGPWLGIAGAAAFAVAALAIVATHRRKRCAIGSGTGPESGRAKR